MVVCIIMALSSLVVLIHAVIDGGWLAVEILSSGLVSNKYSLPLQNFHEYGFTDN